MAIVWEFLCTLTWSGRDAQLWTQEADSCDSLAALLGADRAARRCRSAGTAGLRDSVGSGRHRRIASLKGEPCLDSDDFWLRVCRAVFFCCLCSALSLCLANGHWPSRCSTSK